MITLNEIQTELIKIREGIDLIETRGHQNAAYVSYCYEKSNSLIAAVADALKELQNGGKNESAPDPETTEG